MPVRVLFCRSNPIAPDPRVEKEARSLSSAGYSVRVLGWDRSGELPQEEKLNGLWINRLPIRAAFGKGIGNLPQLLRWQTGLTSWLFRNRKEYDLIHACDFDTILPALIMKKLFGKHVVYDIFDFYADHLRATPAWIKELIRALDLQAINHADALILVDDSRCKQVARSHPTRLVIIYNSPEDELLSGQDNRSAIAHPFRIAYIGLLQIERGLLPLIDVLRRHPEWQLDLAGFGGDQEMILDHVRDLPNVCWHGRVPYQKALELSRNADALIATYDPAIPNHRYSSPNKIFEAMMLGKPILVARDSNMDQIVEKAHCGLVVPYGDTASLESVLTRLCEDGDLREQLGQNARLAYESDYSWQIMQNRLLELYRQVLPAA